MGLTRGREEYLLKSQARFHRIYRERIASADGRQEAMREDLADFDKGIELLLQGFTHSMCEREINRFSTVYNWISQRSVPLSFRDYTTTTGLGKINVSVIEDSPSLAYLVGIYQAKTTGIRPWSIAIGPRDYSLANAVQTCFNALHIATRTREVNPLTGKLSKRIRYRPSRLMSYISEITENNSRIPHLFFAPDLMKAYLSGFFDARASVSYSRGRPACSSIIRKYPMIRIEKKGNVPLMSAINSALHFLGIASVYNPSKNSGGICIAKMKSIKRFIDLGLFRSREKMSRLRELYDYQRETNEFDRNGAYEKLKKQIVLERVREKDTFAEDARDIQDEDDWD